MTRQKHLVSGQVRIIFLMYDFRIGPGLAELLVRFLASENGLIFYVLNVFLFEEINFF